MSMIQRSWLLPALFIFSTLAWSGEPVDFRMTDIQGHEHKLSDYRGKWVVVNYWATWCPPCRKEIPELDAFHVAHKDKDAVVLGIALELASKEQVEEFMAEQFMSYPVFIDQPRRETVLGPVPGLPTTYVVSPEGEVVAWQVGGITRDLLEKFLAKAGKQAKAP